MSRDVPFSRNHYVYGVCTMYVCMFFLSAQVVLRAAVVCAVSVVFPQSRLCVFSPLRSGAAASRQGRGEVQRPHDLEEPGPLAGTHDHRQKQTHPTG